MFAGAFAEPDGCGEGSCRGEVPVIVDGVGCEVVEEACGGGADDGEPPALPVGVIDGDVVECSVWAVGERMAICSMFMACSWGLLDASEVLRASPDFPDEARPQIRSPFRFGVRLWSRQAVRCWRAEQGGAPAVQRG